MDDEQVLAWTRCGNGNVADRDPMHCRWRHSHVLRLAVQAQAGRILLVDEGEEEEDDDLTCKYCS